MSLEYVDFSDENLKKLESECNKIGVQALQAMTDRAYEEIPNGLGTVLSSIAPWAKTFFGYAFMGGYELGSRVTKEQDQLLHFLNGAIMACKSSVALGLITEDGASRLLGNTLIKTGSAQAIHYHEEYLRVNMGNARVDLALAATKIVADDILRKAEETEGENDEVQRS